MNIPVSDADEALAFCRALAAQCEAALPAPAPEVSVVLPVHNEQDNLPELHRRLCAALENRVDGLEIVYVNDGSRDGSLDVLRALAQQTPGVTVVDLARNFGHQIAISAGMAQARGRAVIVMDADLQDPPELLPDLIDEWKSGFDVVYAVRQDRKESWAKRSCYALFYRLLKRMANIDIPLDTGDFCIMDRKVVDLLNAMPERNRFVRGIRSWVGLRQKGMPYERHARHAGTPAYTWRKLIVLALDGLISFSQVPLRAASILGALISTAALGMGLFYFVKKLTVGLEPAGFATTITAIFFFAGVQLLTLGMVGEYIGRIFDEVKQRPLYVVRSVIRHPGDPCAS